ncbi:MAG: alpha/beta hydrolase [Promethearchaeota archaeon]|nr:MAG: alpha/beta hydrolase [Candidatus Lokiarchaeota archaeon]
MYFEALDGTKLHGRMAGCGRKLVIWVPGAGSNITDAELWCEPLEDRYGYSTFSYDLRGKGASEGSIMDFTSQIEDIKAAIDVAIQKMKDREKGPDRVILIGHSLGALACLKSGVQDPRVDLVFALSTIYSIEDYLADKEDIEQIDRENLIDDGVKPFIEKIKAPLKGSWWFKRFVALASGGSSPIMPKYHLTNALMEKIFLVHGKKDKFVPFEKSAKNIIEEYKLSEEKYLLVDGGHELKENVDEILNWIDEKIKNEFMEKKNE